MNFSFTDEHVALRAMMREFAQSRIAPHAEQWDTDHHFPTDVIEEMGDLGLFGITADAEWGGAIGDFTILWFAIE